MSTLSRMFPLSTATNAMVKEEEQGKALQHSNVVYGTVHSADPKLTYHVKH